MAQNPNLADIQVLRTLAHGSITANYVAVGDQYTKPIRAFRLINNTNGDLFVSVNGDDDHYFLPESTSVTWDVTANGAANEKFKVGGYLQFYTKFSTDPSSGALFIEAFS